MTKLNDADDIRLGIQPVSAIYAGPDLVWAQPNPPVLRTFDLVAAPPVAAWGTAASTLAVRGSVDRALLAKSVRVHIAGGAPTYECKPVIYRVSDGALVADGPLVTYQVSAGAWIDLPLTTPYTLQADVAYTIGQYGTGGSSGPGYINGGIAAGTTVESDPAGATFTWTAAGTWLVGFADANPTTQDPNYTVTLGLTGDA